MLHNSFAGRYVVCKRLFGTFRQCNSGADTCSSLITNGLRNIALSLKKNLSKDDPNFDHRVFLIDESIYEQVSKQFCIVLEEELGKREGLPTTDISINFPEKILSEPKSAIHPLLEWWKPFLPYKSSHTTLRNFNPITAGGWGATYIKCLSECEEISEKYGLYDHLRRALALRSRISLHKKDWPNVVTSATDALHIDLMSTGAIDESFLDGLEPGTLIDRYGCLFMRMMAFYFLQDIQAALADYILLQKISILNRGVAQGTHTSSRQAFVNTRREGRRWGRTYADQQRLNAKIWMVR